MNKIKLSQQFETWQQTIARLSGELDDRVAESMSVINKAIQDYPSHKKVVFTSTGKDSMITLDLVNRVLPDVGVYFNNTTLDTGDTYKMVKDHKDWTIINPDIGFYKYIFKEHFIPTRFSRGCFQNIMEMTDEQWGEAIEGFKAQGCELF